MNAPLKSFPAEYTLAKPIGINKEWLCVGLLMALALGIRAFFLSHMQIVGSDEAFYVRMGQDIAEGKKPVTFVLTTYIGQPLNMALFALACKYGPDPVIACRWVSLIAGVLTLIPLHFCVRSFGSVRAALWTDFAYSLMPFAIHYSLWAMQHALFNAACICMLLFSLQCQKQPRLLWAILSGIAAWGAYMSRPEGFALAFFVAVGAFLLPWLSVKAREKKSQFFLASAFVVTFLVLCLPVWLWIKSQSGRWELVWSVGQGASGLFVRRLVGSTQESLLLEGAGGLRPFPALLWLLQYARTLWKEYALILPGILPLALWIFAGMGAAGVTRQGKEFAKAVLLVVFFAIFPMLFYALIGFEARMLHPTVLCLAVFVGPGVASLENFLVDFMKSRFRKAIAVVACSMVLVLNFLPAQRILLLGFCKEMLDLKEAGLWVRQHFSSPLVMVGTDIRAGFYAGPALKKFIPFPYVRNFPPTRQGWRDFLIHHQVDLLVAEETFIAKYYPEYMFLLDPEPGESLNHLLTLGSGKTKVIIGSTPRAQITSK